MSADPDEVVCPECGRTMTGHSATGACPPEFNSPQYWAELQDRAGLSNLGQLPLNEYGFPIYPAGTPIGEVREFDRGQKVVMVCKDHPLSIWASKDPYVSRWFAARREYEECDCKLTNYVLAEDYSPTRNG